jgi:hypothetical protein
VTSHIAACEGVRASGTRVGHRFWCDPRFERFQRDHVTKFLHVTDAKLLARPAALNPNATLQYQVCLSLARPLHCD